MVHGRAGGDGAGLGLLLEARLHRRAQRDGALGVGRGLRARPRRRSGGLGLTVVLVRRLPLLLRSVVRVSVYLVGDKRTVRFVTSEYFIIISLYH